MDALDLLTADHNRVRGLFGRFKDAENEDDTAGQAELAGKIVEELEVHTTIGEEIFYPAVHDLSSPIGDSVDEGLEEHHVAKTLIGELGPLKAGSDQWVAKMKVLIEAVEHHADEEEKEMFPKVRSATDAGKRSARSWNHGRSSSAGSPRLTTTATPLPSSARRRASRRSPVARRWTATSSPRR
jgi:hemerythrin superfamily protein